MLLGVLGRMLCQAFFAECAFRSPARSGSSSLWLGGGPLGGSWDALGRSWDVLGRLWAFLGAFWALLERSWSLLGSLGLQVVDFLVIFG